MLFLFFIRIGRSAPSYLPIPDGEREPGLFLFDLHIVVKEPFRHEGVWQVPVILPPHHVQEARVDDHICV